MAYYAVVQHVSDPMRDERTNVAVLLATDDDVRLHVASAEATAGSDVITRFAELLEHLLASEYPEHGIGRGRAALHDLTQRRFSQFKLTEPRVVDIGSRDLDDAAQELAARLVDPANEPVSL